MPGPKPKPPLTRFMALTEQGESCWQWTGARQPEGYGRFSIARGRSVLAHRWSYEHHVGPIPEGATIDHLCRNTSCVNPAHMEPVSREVNAYRGNRNVGKTHCDHGHEFTPANTYTPPGRPQVRECRECRKVNSQTYYLRRKSSEAA